MAAKDIEKYRFTSDQSRTEAAKNGRKGGIASGESKRRRKRFNEELDEALAKKGVQSNIAISLINQAINGNKAGDVTKAIELILQIVGEAPNSLLENSEEAETVILVAREKVVPPHE